MAGGSAADIYGTVGGGMAGMVGGGAAGSYGTAGGGIAGGGGAAGSYGTTGGSMAGGGAAVGGCALSGPVTHSLFTLTLYWISHLSSALALLILWLSLLAIAPRLVAAQLVV